MKKILAVILVLALVFSFTGCGQDKDTKKSGTSKTNEKEKEVKQEQREAAGSITFGSITELGGDFYSSMWSSNGADMDVQSLIHGYSIFAYQKETGSSELDTNVAEDFKAIENEDGSKTFEVTIKKDLCYNDGTPITAKDYVFTVLLQSHPEVTDLKAGTTYGYSFVGYDEYNSRPEGKTEGQISDVFAGVRLLDDYKFSVTVRKDELPYYYDQLNASIAPTPIKVVAPNADVVDEGKGCKITGDFTTEILEKTLCDTDTGYRYYPKVTCGPYMLDSFDTTTRIAVLKYNPKFKGDYNGQKPQIAQIVVKKVSDATQVDELVAGQVDILPEVGGKKGITPGLDAVDQDKIDYETYERCGYGKINFVCDIGPTQFLKVRQAIAHLLDVPEFARQYSGGYATTVYGAYGLAQWMYKENAAKIEEEFNKYPLDIEKAKQLLIEDGWTLNSKGEEFKEGVDKVRYKKVDGKLMELFIKHLATTDNPVSDLLSTMLPANMEKVGMKYEQTAVTFPVLVTHLTGQVPERTFNMMNLASAFYPEFSPYFSYRTEDEYMGTHNRNYIKDEELAATAKAIKNTQPGDKAAYSKNWYAFQKRWNEVLPDIPLYSDQYHCFFSKKLKNYSADAFWTFTSAILYAYVEE